MYYVYILKNYSKNKFYKGFTNDLKRRMKEHNAGEAAFTKNNGPWELVYYEAFVDERAARRQELFYKTGQGRRILKKRLNFLSE